MERLLDLYKNCRLCPRACGVNRTDGELGFCKAGAEVCIASYMAHRFEEPPISGSNGSGAIFFSFCTARCSYCQNYEYSRGNRTKPVSIKRLSQIMLELQHKGCHNINLVTPTHYVPSIIEAVLDARAHGLKVPVLYNTNGYETIDTLKLLEGVIQIYLPDAKYSDDKLAKQHCGFVEYSRYNIAALVEMHRQVGDLECDDKGIAVKGLIIRHLVLPGYLENTKALLEMITAGLSNKVYMSFMNQYSPIIHVKDHSHLGRRLTEEEYEKAKSYLHELGLDNGWVQE